MTAEELKKRQDAVVATHGIWKNVPDERTAQEELEILRVSVARIAQVLGTQTSKPVKNKVYEELAEMAKQERGWNALCCEIYDRLFDSQYRCEHCKVVYIVVAPTQDEPPYFHASFCPACRNEAKIIP